MHNEFIPNIYLTWIELPEYLFEYLPTDSSRKTEYRSRARDRRMRKFLMKASVKGRANEVEIVAEACR